MIDKSKELRASLTLVNDKVQFTGIVENNPAILIDYIQPIGDDMGYTSLELLLLSLSSCLGTAMLLFLRRMHKTIISLDIQSKGLRKDEHPTCFKKIILDVNIKTTNITDDDFNKVVKLAEDTYCPVWAMLKGNVEIEINKNIIVVE